MENGYIGRPLTRRFLLGQTGMAGLALATAPAWAQATIDLGLPGGPSARPITTAFPQKTAMILQRSRPPLLETPFEVFDKGVFTPNNEFYVRWHWRSFRPRSTSTNSAWRCAARSMRFYPCR